MWALFPWLGSYAFLALERFLKIRCDKRLGLKGLDPLQALLSAIHHAGERVGLLSDHGRKRQNRTSIPWSWSIPTKFQSLRKYDEYVPAELVRKGFALGVLDVEGHEAEREKLV